ncbi:MAG: hypothetical protein LUF68_04890 [Clostridiales bacterium]|nr:hypothetical protein [Clostridiales bacterium]
MSDIKIPVQLFSDLIRWHLMGEQDEARQRRIATGLEDKMRRVAARQEYAARLKDRGD